MSDDIDMACAREQEERDRAIAAARGRPEMRFTGHCLNCDAPLTIGFFCDGDCREDYERRLYSRKMGGFL